MSDSQHPPPAENNAPILRMESITKRFPGIVANQEVTLRVQPGAFHAVIGENGAGKSTLLNILYGRYHPDAGHVFVREADVTDTLHSPADSIRMGIGMVSQHYALIPALTVLENVVLGSEPILAGGVLDQRVATERIEGLVARLGLAGIDLKARAERLSVAAQQKVEILKALFRQAQILLLDEPTATLAPPEAEALFALLTTLRQNGATIVFVTHKLREVMAHSDAVTVLRRGRNAGDFRTADTTAESLLACMLGPRAPLSAPGLSLAVENAGEAATPVTGPLLTLSNVSIRNTRHAPAVQEVSLEIKPGEILGIAGVDGSGQKELSDAIIGLRAVESGSLTLHDAVSGTSIDLGRRSVRERQRLGIAYIPEDRHRAGMILDFSIAENYLLGHETQPEWGGGVLLKKARLQDRAMKMIRDYDVRVGNRDATAPGGALSGGNQQKVVIARTLDSNPRLLVACQPTRGLDRGATEFVYTALRTARDRGLGVLLFSLDLDEVLELSDRIAVLFNGRLVGVLPRAEATPERIGALMTGSQEAS